ncbi:MAG: dihydrofolate reductase family protein [Candidatus Levyibacteriota bacterium]
MAEAEPQTKNLPEVRAVTEQEIYEIYIAKDLSPKPSQKVRVIINMVESLDGVTTIFDENGNASEQGIGNPVDQRLMRHLRFHADATLNGSATLRASGSDSTIDEDRYPQLIAKRREMGKSDNPIACVMTSKANPEEFDEEVLTGKKSEFFRDRRFHSILFVGEDAPEENLKRIRQVIPTGKKFDLVRVPNGENGRPDVKALVEILHEKYSVKTLLSEGGARLNHSLLVAGLISDLFQTIALKAAGASPKTNGIIEGEETLSRGDLVDFELMSNLYEPTGNAIYLHSSSRDQSL